MALGRPPSDMMLNPRAMAPLDTSTTSSPAARRAATSAQMPARTSPRTEPSSLATIPEPSLMTWRAMRARSLDGLARIELEDDPGDLDVVARLEALGLQRADDAHAVQARLDVHERLLVLEVVARDEPLDARARHAPRALVELL